MSYSLTVSDVTNLFGVDVTGGSWVDLSGDPRVSSSSVESQNNFLKDFLPETGVSRSLLISAFVGVTIYGRGGRVSSKGLTSAAGAGWGQSCAPQPQWRAALIFGVAPSSLWPLSRLSLKEEALYKWFFCPWVLQGGRAGH